MKRIIKQNYVCIISMVLVFFALLLYMVIYKVQPFGDNTLVTHDCYQAMSPMLVVLRRKLLTGGSLLYYWNGYLGGDFLSLFFYHLASPLNLFVVFFEEENINLFISITIIIRIVLAAGTFSYSLSRMYKEQNVFCIIALSFAYALSGYVCGYKYNIMWFDSYVLFPLILLGYSRLKDRKPFLYVITLAFSAFCNFFMTYIIAVFLILWFLIDSHESIKAFFKEAIYFGMMSLMSVGLSFFSLSTAFLASQKSYASGKKEFVHYWLGNIFEVIRYQFIFSKPIATSYELNNVNLYCGLFAFIVLFIYLFCGSISLKQRIKRICLIIFLYISMNDYLLIYIWHGLHIPNGLPNRFSFCLIYLLLITAYDVIEKKEENKKIVIVGSVISEAILLCCYYVSGLDSALSPFVVLITSSVFILAYGIIFVIRNDKYRKISNVAFMVMVILELSANMFVTFSFYNAKDPWKSYYNYFRDNIEEVDQNDNSLFYRSEIIGGEVINNNLDLYYNINGRSGFNSLIPKETNNTLFHVGGSSTEMCITPIEYSEVIDSLLGIKYLYSKNVQSDSTDLMCYKTIGCDDKVTVYENTIDTSIGYAVKANSNSFKLFDDRILDNINKLCDAFIPGFDGKDIYEKKDLEYTVESECDISIDEGDGIRVSLSKNRDMEEYVFSVFHVKENGNYVMDFSTLNDVEIQIYRNLDFIKTVSVYGEKVINLGGFQDGDEISIGILGYVDGIEDNQYNISFAKVNEEKLEIFKDYLDSNRFEITSFSDRHIMGSIDIKDDQSLFLSIPYDEGWHVYENGIEIKKQKLIQSFIGVELEKGKHDIELIYTPQGYNIGIIISIVSIIFFVGYNILEYIKNRKISK